MVSSVSATFELTVPVARACAIKTCDGKLRQITVSVTSTDTRLDIYIYIAHADAARLGGLAPARPYYRVHACAYTSLLFSPHDQPTVTVEPL